MQALVLVAALIGVVVSIPAKLDTLQHFSRGYNYDPPPQPSGLYEVPDPTTTTTTTTTTTPPPNFYLPPEDKYLPPDASNQYFIQEPVPSVTQPPKMEMLMPYEFSYGVDDDESGSKFSHQVDSDGRYVTGEYSVLLPDGRTQIVKFSSSPETGYVADVTYV